MIIPPFLKQGDTIGIVAPARFISMKEMEPTQLFLKKYGFKVLCANNIYEQYHQLAGPDERRVAECQAMLDNTDIKALWAVRGGYGTVRIIDKLDFTSLINHPKWICGYSDITVLHSHIHRHCNMATLHCTMPVNILSFPDPVVAKHSFLNAITGRKLHYNFKAHPLNKQGEANAPLVGGNLSILYSLLGSTSDIDTSGKILFIEEVDEYLYHIDRMMMNLKRNGKLDKLAGLLVGKMTKMHDNKIPYGKNAQEIIAEHCQDYSFPICFDFNAGHIKRNHSLRLGESYYLSSTQNDCTLISI